MTKKKLLTEKSKEPVWEHVISLDAKHESWTLAAIMDLVPKGTKAEDILLSFDVEEEPTYYDEHITSVYMHVSMRKR